MISVIGQGPSDAKIIFIADTASESDLLKGHALSGAAERTLRELCTPTEIKLGECYRTCYIKNYLKGFGYSRKKDKELITGAQTQIAPLTFEEILFNEIQALNPHVIVPLGNLSLKLLTGVGPHYKYRGSILNLPDFWREKYNLSTSPKVIPTFAPQDIYADYTKFSIALVDFQRKIVPNRNNPSPYKDDSILWICKSGEEAFNFFHRNKDNSFVACDIETFHGIPSCISFCFDGRESVSFPLLETEIPRSDQILIYHEVAKVLNSPIRKVFQNGKFDIIILERFGWKINNFYADTMLAFHTIYPELASRGGDEVIYTPKSIGYGKNLGFLTSIYTNFPYHKDEGKGHNLFPPSKEYLLYNAKDSLVTNIIWSEEIKELDELGLTHFFHNKVMPLFYIYKNMETRGIQIDNSRRIALRSKYLAYFQYHEQELRELLNEAEFNARSAPQVGRLVYETLKFPIRKKYGSEDDSTKYATDEETLEELAIIHGGNNRYGLKGKTILYKIITVRKLHKIIEYIDTPIHPDGRLRSSWNLAGTETGRTSGGKSTDRLLCCNGKSKAEFVRLGRSLQTITKHGFKTPDGDIFGKDIREIFVPTRGFVFIEIDQSQAEARHVSVLANDGETLSILEKKDFKRNKYGVKDDLHTITASWVLEKSWELVTEEERQNYGKPARHGGAYGMSPKRFSLMYHRSIEDSKRIIEKFHKHSPKIQGVFWAEIDAFLRSNRYLSNCYGRRRDFLGRYDDDTFKEGLAYIPQGGVSDHQKFTMLKASRDWFHYLVEAHDSTLTEVPIGREKEFAELFKTELEQPIDYRNCCLPREFDLVIPGDISVGENWGQMRPFKW